MTRVTTSELKIMNKRNIIQYIYQQQKTAKQEIATQLHLSLPTVTQALKDLTEAGLIEKNGYFESTGGRKADAILFRASAKVAIGIELLKDRYEILAINLYGEILKSSVFWETFQHEEAYYEAVCISVKEFISSVHLSDQQILGVGIVLQGIISSNGTEVTYGKILGCTGLHVKTFMKFLPYQCSMIHDAEAAANLELWNIPSLQNAIFFHIRDNLSGAIIVDGCFLKGRELKSGVFEHMTIVPGGHPCYCGKKGCVETYCSLNALIGEPVRENADGFFQTLRSGDKRNQNLWNDYLQHLSTALDNLHMFMDGDIILGGILAQYLIQEDIDKLHLLIREQTAFPTQRAFIKISRSAGIPIAKGAALPYVKQFLADL